MRIELKPMPPQVKGVAVGTLDGRPLVYVGRAAHVDGQPLPHSEIAEALAEAIDRVASELLGGEWSKPLALVTGLNPRTVNRDRIRQWGLPVWVLTMLGQAAEHELPRALGHALQAAAIIGMQGDRYRAGDGPALAKVILDEGAYGRGLADLAAEYAALAKEERRKATLARAAREETKS